MAQLPSLPQGGHENRGGTICMVLFAPYPGLNQHGSHGLPHKFRLVLDHGS